MSKALVVMMVSVKAIRERPSVTLAFFDCVERLKKAERWACGREEMAAASSEM